MKKVICKKCGNDKFYDTGERASFCMKGAGGHDLYRCSECNEPYAKRYYDEVQERLTQELYEDEED